MVLALSLDNVRSTTRSSKVLNQGSLAEQPFHWTIDISSTAQYCSLDPWTALLQGQEGSAVAPAQPSPSLSATAAATATAALVFVQEKADNFVQLMLRMDKPSITLESKWADLQQLRHDEIG